MRRATAILIEVTLFLGCVSTKRPDRTLQDMVSARRADDVARADEASELFEKLLNVPKSRPTQTRTISMRRGRPSMC